MAFGEKIVNVLVPFTKPQPKSNLQDPRAETVLQAVASQLWTEALANQPLQRRKQQLTPWGLTICPKAGCSGSELQAQAPTTEAADGQGCAQTWKPEPRVEKPPGETWHLAEAQHTTQQPQLLQCSECYLEQWPRATGRAPWSHNFGQELTCSQRVRL